MQATNMSSMPASPATPPGEKPSQAASVLRQGRKPGGRARWWGLLLVVVLGAGAWYWQGAKSAKQSAQSQAVSIPVKEVASATLESTIRLTGVTAAENYVSLTSPQLRGSRSGMFGRQGASFQSGVNTSTAVASNAGRSNSSPGASSGSSGGRTLSSALSAATSRTSSSSSKSTSSTAASTSPTASGGDGLGSTSAALASANPPGGGGGGGGGFGGEFAMTLMSLAKSGSQVKKGDTVAEFDRVYMLNRVDDYKSSVAQTEASYRNLIAQLEVGLKAKQQAIAAAKAQVEKAKLDLKTTPVLSAMDAERLNLAFESAEANHQTLTAQFKLYEEGQKAQIKGAQIELEQGGIELRRAEVNANRMIMKAPLDGLAVIQNVFRGGESTAIQQGDQLMPGQFFMQIVDTRSMVINASVNQVDAERMRIGARARVKFDAYPNLVLPGHVISVGGMAKSGGARDRFVKELPVRIRLEKLDPRVIPDLSVGVEVILAQEENVTVAPLHAVFRDEPSGPAYVYVRQPEGWIRREVELGIASFLDVAVRKGLQPGEVVALTRPQQEKAS